MNLSTHRARRAVAAAAIAATAILLPAVALAASGGSATPNAPAQPGCGPSQLTAWLGVPGNGAAGSTYYQLEISNISRRTCTLYGYPGVSAVSGGHQLGSAGGRDPSHRSTLVTLPPNSTAHVILQITDVYNFPPQICKPTRAYLLRVYPPGDYSALQIPFSFEACARRGPVFLHMTSVIAGTGIPGYSY